MAPGNFNLEQVGIAFDNWRNSSSRAGKSPIPESLWEMVSVIYHHYPRNKICQRLGLSSSQLKRRGYASDEPDGADFIEGESSSPMFVDISPDNAPGLATPDNNKAPTIEVVRPDGTMIRLRDVQPSQLSNFFQQLVGG